MSKKVARRMPDMVDYLPEDKEDVYSVSSCISDDFMDYIDYWKHNGYWFFDSPKIIDELAQLEDIDLSGNTLFYYEAFFDEH
ncbi:hypothetical protein FACS1894170_12570 [Planctomycetales bacterium]|nr:hypothetical protein FACS1894170_12570 [Planctomycetales bacterium]